MWTAYQPEDWAAIVAELSEGLKDHDPRARVAEVVREVFPWVTFLSRDDMHEFGTELVATLRATAALNDPALLVQVVEAWQHTADDAERLISATPGLAEMIEEIAARPDSEFDTFTGAPRRQQDRTAVDDYIDRSQQILDALRETPTEGNTRPFRGVSD